MTTSKLWLVVLCLPISESFWWTAIAALWKQCVVMSRRLLREPILFHQMWRVNWTMYTVQPYYIIIITYKLPISLCLSSCCQGQQSKSNYDSSIHYIDEEAAFLLDYVKVVDGSRLFLVQVSIFWLVVCFFLVFILSCQLFKSLEGIQWF